MVPIIKEYQPLVSVVIPTYNSKKTFEKTVQSALNQTYANKEILIIDDASKDGTRDLINAYMTRYPEIKVHFKKQNRGVADSRNIGISMAKGKYVAFLDSDDLWCEDKLEKQIDFMERNEIVFSYTNYYVYEKGEDKAELIKSPLQIRYQDLLRSNTIGCLTVVFNKDVIGNVSIPLIEKRNDYSLWLEILSGGYTAYLYDEALSIKVNYANSLSSGSKTSLLKYHYQLFREHRKMSVIRSVFYTFLNGFHYFIKSLKPKQSISIQKMQKDCKMSHSLTKEEL